MGDALILNELRVHLLVTTACVCVHKTEKLWAFNNLLVLCMLENWTSFWLIEMRRRLMIV
jgi:hypothetical protein